MVIARKGEKVSSRMSPGGRLMVKHKAKKPSRAICGLCGSKLGGVPRVGVGGLAKLAKTEKRPERAFGGVLCHKCVAGVLKNKARLASGQVTKRDIDLRHLKYIKA